MSKTINKIQIEIKAHITKDYASVIHVIDIDYILKPGDKIYSLHYSGRGLPWYSSLILDVTEQNITIKDYFNGILTLDFNKEPDYSKVNENYSYMKSEERELIIRPFPKLAIGTNINKVFENVTFHDKAENEYIKNLENLAFKQLSFA